MRKYHVMFCNISLTFVPDTFLSIRTVLQRAGLEVLPKQISSLIPTRSVFELLSLLLLDFFVSHLTVQLLHLEGT